MFARLKFRGEKSWRRRSPLASPEGFLERAARSLGRGLSTGRRVAINSRAVAWLLVAALTASLTALTTAQALRRYHDLQSGWSWDLAYYNQWFWLLSQGGGELTVRPIASYSIEGPSIWRMNYLAPIRFILAPFYLIFPDPRVLLIIHGIVFWWVIPAAHTLVRSELEPGSRSEWVALSAAFLVPLTPLLWPLAWNDFRELQLAFPFVLWAVQGIRSRRIGLSALGIGGMLACRQEFAALVVLMAFLPPRRPEDSSTTGIWRLVIFDVGLIWILFGFFGYLELMVGPRAAEAYVNEFLGPRATIAQTLETAGELMFYGVGGWTFLALLAPRVAVLAIPWIWSLCGGRWALWLLAGPGWHHVRYTVPLLAMSLAAGLVGYARLANWLRARPGGPIALALAWLLAAGVGLTGLHRVMTLMEEIPPAVAPADVAPYWTFVRQVKPDETVLAAYEFTAPLSSRRGLYSYIMFGNPPKGFPTLGPEFTWIFLRASGLDPEMFIKQGFRVVHRGESLIVLRRDAPNPQSASGPLERRADREIGGSGGRDRRSGIGPEHSSG